MRKKENWMQIGSIVNVSGKLGRIVKMQENTIDNIDYVYYIDIVLSGETEKRRYHPNDISEIKTFE